MSSNTFKSFNPKFAQFRREAVSNGLSKQIYRFSKQSAWNKEFDREQKLSWKYDAMANGAYNRYNSYLHSPTRFSNLKQIFGKNLHKQGKRFIVDQQRFHRQDGGYRDAFVNSLTNNMGDPNWDTQLNQWRQEAMAQGINPDQVMMGGGFGRRFSKKPNNLRLKLKGKKFIRQGGAGMDAYYAALEKKWEIGLGSNNWDEQMAEMQQAAMRRGYSGQFGGRFSNQPTWGYNEDRLQKQQWQNDAIMNGVNPNSVYRSLNPIGKKLKAKKFVKEVLSRFHKKQDGGYRDAFVNSLTNNMGDPNWDTQLNQWRQEAMAQGINPDQVMMGGGFGRFHKKQDGGYRDAFVNSLTNNMGDPNWDTQLNQWRQEAMAQGINPDQVMMGGGFGRRFSKKPNNLRLKLKGKKFIRQGGAGMDAYYAALEKKWEIGLGSNNWDEQMAEMQQAAMRRGYSGQFGGRFHKKVFN